VGHFERVVRHERELEGGPGQGGLQLLPHAAEEDLERLLGARAGQDAEQQRVDGERGGGQDRGQPDEG
jgi:hypothetical protein